MLGNEAVKPRRFEHPNLFREIVFTPEALRAFELYRQTGDQLEGGGLLFAEFEPSTIKVVEASLPNASDRRWKTLFIPNRILQRQLITRYFKKGWHFVGEWHTHPEPAPTPSSLDLHSMTEAFTKSKHDLSFFLMVIVGNREDHLNLWVSGHTEKVHYLLNEASSGS